MYHYYNYAELFKPEEVLDYLRKSRSDDPTLTVEEVLSKHEAMLDDWAEQNLGGKVPPENKFFEVVSGETIKERPEFQKVLQLIESPKYKAIKVVEVQRLSRGDLEDAGRLIKLLRYSNTYVITPQKVYDLRDDYDRDAFERELKRGNEYLEYTKKIMKNGKLLSVSQGNYISSIPPYGYDKTVVMDGKRKCPTLKENPEQANVVRMIYDMYGNKNMGRTAICYRLDELGVKPPRGERWAPTAVREMLRNVHYIGKVKWNWRKTVNIVENSEIKKKRPTGNLEEFMIYEGKHAAIVSQELFDKVQERLGNNHRATSRVKLRNPLAGIMYCRCGRVMVLKYFRDKSGKEYCAPRVMCSDQSRCGSGSCTYEEILDRVCDILRQCINDFEIRIKADAGTSVKLHAELIKNLEKRLAELQAQELSQWEAQTHPDLSKRMPPEIFAQLNEKLLKEKEEVQQALCNAHDTMPEPVDYEEKIACFTDALNALQNPNADTVLQNELLKACIERITFYKAKPTRKKGGNWSSPPIELDVKLKV